MPTASPLGVKRNRWSRAAVLRLGGCSARRRVGALGLAIWLSAVHVAGAQQYGEARYDDVSLTPLLGPWIRNDQLSEDPVLKTGEMWQGKNDSARLLRKLAGDAADEFDTVLIRVIDGSMMLQDGRGSFLTYPLDLGEYHRPRGNVRSRLLRLEDPPAIRTATPEWRRVETLHRVGEQLVRVAEFHGSGPGKVEFRTVYDRPGSAGIGYVAKPATIRIVLPQRHGELLGGKVRVQTLIIDPRVAAVDFLLDGQLAKRVNRLPFATNLQLADPAREQTLDVQAWGAVGEALGSDTIVLNRLDTAFTVRIAGIRPDDDGVRVEAAVWVPRTAALERVEFYRSGKLASAVDEFAVPADGTSFTVEAQIVDVGPDDFLRVSARLADGREREDAELLVGAEFQNEIDVQLVQLQVLVVDRDGNPASDLKPEDFVVREDGEQRQVENLFVSNDIPLSLGLAIDSSDSVLPIWRDLKTIAASFVESSLSPGDRAFLVDFDDRVRLLQPLTGDKVLLVRALGRLIPFGGTALNDGLLFSLLQYDREPGRRALVVITDGADRHSRSRPRQSADFAEHLGLPIYFIELDPTVGQAVTRFGDRLVDAGSEARQRQNMRNRFEWISQRTGGRLFHVRLSEDDPPWTDRIGLVFDRIEEDLRQQHVLTYYSGQPLGDPVEPEVRVVRRGLSLRSALPLERAAAKPRTRSRSRRCRQPSGSRT